MKYGLMVRSRSRMDQPISGKHERLFAELSRIPPPWGIARHAIPGAPDIGSRLTVGLSFSKLLGKGITARAYYSFRYSVEDLGMHDDFLDLGFNPQKVDYRQLLYEVLPKLLKAFDAYFARVGDVEFVHKDFKIKQAAGLTDSRHGVYRVYPVSFFDNVLCNRAFGISASDVVSRLEGHVERVELLNGGAYIIGSSKALEIDEADELCWEMMRRIKGGAYVGDVSS